MARSVTISISASANGNGLVSATYNPPMSPMQNINAVDGIPVNYVLPSGASNLVAPAGTTQALVVPVLNSTNPKTCKTTSGDVGIAFTSTPVLIPIAGGATLYFTSTASDSVDIVWG